MASVPTLRERLQEMQERMGKEVLDEKEFLIIVRNPKNRDILSVANNTSASSFVEFVAQATDSWYDTVKEGIGEKNAEASVLALAGIINEVIDQKIPGDSFYRDTIAYLVNNTLDNENHDNLSKSYMVFAGEEENKACAINGMNMIAIIASIFSTFDKMIEMGEANAESVCGILEHGTNVLREKFCK